MAMKTSGQLSIQTAEASADGQINTNVSGVNSGSLVTLGQNSTQWTGGTAPSSLGGVANTQTSPYGMREYYGYQEYIPSHPSYSSLTLPNVSTRQLPTAGGSTLENYDWKSFNSYWTSGNRPPNYNTTSGRYGQYSSNTTYYSGGGMYLTVLRYRFKVVIDTYGGSDSDGPIYYVRMYARPVNQYYFQVQNATSNSVGTTGTNYHAASGAAVGYWGYQIYSAATLPSSLSLDIDTQSTSTGFFGPTTFTAAASNSSADAGDWPISAQSNGTQNYSSANQNYTIHSYLLNGNFWTFPTLSANQSAVYSGDILMQHTAECSSSVDYRSLKFGLTARKSGYADSLITAGVVGHKDSLYWSGGYCF